MMSRRFAAAATGWIERRLAVCGVPTLPAEEVAALAGRRLVATVRAAARTPWHAERLRAAAGREAWPRGLTPGDAAAILAALPPVTKRDLRLADTAAVRDGWVRPWWPSSASSGSTGEPLRVYYDPAAWLALKYLVKLRARAACGVAPSDRIAVLDAIDVAEEGRALPERFGFVRRFSVLQPTDALAAKLAAFAPDAVYGLPSALLEVARAFARAGHVPRARRLFTSGELLTPPTRRALADGWGARVFDVYGCSETKEIAWECPAGGMHVNADVLKVEVLGPDGAPVPPGVEGDLVVTLLVNRAMPLLRYRIGDRGMLLDERCACGSALPLLGIVTGRETDVVTLPDGQRLSPYVLTMAIEGVPGVLQYQITQLAPTRLRVRAVPAAAADRGAIGREIEAALRRSVRPALDVEIEFVERIPPGPRGKTRVVEPWRGA